MVSLKRENSTKSEGLVSKFRDGDEQICREILRICERNPYAHARGTDGGHIIGETLLKIWTGREKYDPEKGAFSTWTRRVAKNVYIDETRKKRRAREMLVEIEAREDLIVEEKRDERKEELDYALRKLPSEQTKLLYAIYFTGLTLKNYGEANEIPLGTVKSRLNTALNNLRKVMGIERLP